MSRRLRWGLSIAAVLVIGAVLFVITGLRHDARIDAEIPALKPGTPVADVTDRFGMPWSRGKCGETFGYPTGPGCEREIVYGSTFAPLIPHYQLIELDRDGRVLRSEQIDSP